MAHDQMLNTLAACAVIALGFLVLGLVIGKIQDLWIDRQIKKAGSFLK
jgi:hypothetical protein